MIASQADFKWIVQRILATHTAESIYLFGSYAKGTAHAGSDIDLLIVGRSSTPRPHRGRNTIGVLRSFPADFDLLFYTPEELEDELRDPNSFASQIMVSARSLYREGTG